jgi:sporulation protein YlmC with PRC-barrel domain
MKTTSKKMAPWVAAILCVTLIGAFKAATPGESAIPRNEPQTKPDTPTTGQPARYNRASGIVGLNVLNHKSERLGEIQDVVFDLQSERVAYVVLQTSSGVLGRGKLLAVPMNAFTASPDQKHLILRADKAKVESAMGFDRDNWPSIGNPSWGAEPFWEPSSSASTEKPKTPAMTPQPDGKPEPKFEQKP